DGGEAHAAHAEPLRARPVKAGAPRELPHEEAFPGAQRGGFRAREPERSVGPPAGPTRAPPRPSGAWGRTPRGHRAPSTTGTWPRPTGPRGAPDPGWGVRAPRRGARVAGGGPGR